MDIELKKRFIGPNLYSAHPVLHFRITGTKGLPTRNLYAEGGQTISSLLPEISPETSPELEPESDCAASRFFTSSESDRSLSVAHAIEHIALALQNRAGSEVLCCRTADASATAGGSEISKRSVVVPYEEAAVGEVAATLACAIAERILMTHEKETGLDPAQLASVRQEIVAEFTPSIGAFLKLANRRMLPVQDRAFVRAAKARDVPTRRVVGRMVQLGHGRYQQRVSATKTTRTNVVSNDIAANKDFSRRFLGELGLPIPEYARVYRQKDAIEAANRIGYPVVVKPNQGNMGRAVSIGMRNRREVRAAYKRAREIDRSVLIEELVEGNDYRLLVINGEFVAASKRTPGHVVGDGKSSVEELVETLNQDPRRGTGPTSPWTRLELDEQADRLLLDRGMERTSIPKKDEVVFLRKNANTSAGGTAIDVTDDVHPDNRQIAVRAARAIGLDIAGVDFLTEDISRSMWRTGGRICEINSRPGLRKHMWPANGPPRDIMTPIVDMLFPPKQASRIPVVGILGVKRSAARRVARLLADTLKRSGHHVGLAVNRRAYINGQKIRGQERTAPEWSQMILMDPDVDIAVLETTVNDVVREGLGCDAFDLLLIVEDTATATAEANQAKETNQAKGLNGTPGEEIDESESPVAEKLQDAIRVVARTTRGEILIGAGSRLHAVVQEQAGQSPIVPVSSDPAAHDWVAAEGSSQNEPPPSLDALFTFITATRLGVSASRARKSILRSEKRARKAKAATTTEAESEGAEAGVQSGVDSDSPSEVGA
jgi:cyanophycin synthetase